MAIAQPQPQVAWKSVLGLSGVQSAITLMWVMYRLYLPTLLVALGLSPETGILLLIVEEGLAIALNPIMGNLSDRNLHWVGTRFPMITAGVILSSALFLVIPALEWGDPSLALRWLMIGIVVFWSVAMTLFYSPVMSLLFTVTALPHLPLASGCLTLASRLIGTAAPLVQGMILNLGAAVTFAVGAIVLLGASTALRLTAPPPDPPQRDTSLPPIAAASVGRIALVGLGIGWGSRLVFDHLGQTLGSRFPEGDVGQWMSWFSISLALLAVPLGWVATRIGNSIALMGGLAIAVVGLITLLAPVSPPLIVAAMGILGIALTLIFNGGFPFALSQMPGQRAGLAIGLYLGGLSGASSLFAWIFKQPETLSPGTRVVMGSFAFLCAAVLTGLTHGHSSQD